VTENNDSKGKVINIDFTKEKDKSISEKTKKKNLNREIKEIMADAHPKKKTTPRHPKKPEPVTSMNITGNGNRDNTLVGRDYITTKTVIKKILPPPDSIGGDPLLKQRITTLFNKIGDERKKRLGGNVFQIMYNNFKRDFKIKNNKWTMIWTWPKECAPAIIEYLEALYGNTIQGRIERAASKKAHIPSRPYLYKKETELLEHFGITMKSPEFREFLEISFGVNSHAQLSHLDHWQLVCSLESLVKKMEGG